ARGRRKPAVTQELLSTINTSGSILLNYIGHGNPRVWAHEQIFVRETTPGDMLNVTKPFFLTAATCDFARYDMTDLQSGAEELLLKADGGAIGVFSAARVVFSSDNARLNNEFYGDLFTRLADGTYPTVGQTMYRVKQIYNNANDEGEVLFLTGNVCEIIFNDTNDSIDIQKIKTYLKFKYTPVFNLGSDLTITNGFCPQNISAPPGFSNYQWNTGATTANISVNQTGSYWVSATDAFGFKWTDTIFVQYPMITPPPTTSICANSSIVWNTGLGNGFNHLWNTGSTSNQLTITQAGTYSVQVIGAGGCAYTSQPINFSLDTYPLTMSLGNDTTLCIGNSVSVQVGAPQTQSYMWNNGTTGSTFPITNTGLAIISLTSTNLNGCVAQDTVLITVNGTAPTINLSVPNSHCSNSLFQASNQSSVPLPTTITNELWSFSNGTQVNGSSIQTSFPSPGWIHGSIHVTASDNCTSMDTFSVYVHLPPNLNIQHLGSCINELILFQASDLNGNSLSNYEWDYFGGFIDTDTVGSHMFNQAGANQVDLVAQNSFGCVDTLQYTFQIAAAPTSAFLINNTCEQTLVVPINTSMANDSTGIQSVMWNFGNGTNDTSFNGQSFYTNEGDYTVSLICHAGNGCSDTSTHAVTIHPKPELNWILSPSCKDNPTQFTSTSSIPSGSIDSTYWLVNLQYPISGLEGQFTFTTLGVQFLNLSAVSSLGCQSDTLIQVHVNPGLSSTFIFEPAICVAGDALILNSTASGISSVNWLVNGIPYSDTTIVHYSIPDSLTGSVISIYSITNNPYGCQDTSFMIIPVYESTLDIEVKQLYLGNQNGQAVVGCELKNLGTIPITGGTLYLSVSGIPRLSGSINDTIMPGNTLYYIFENSPALSGISENNSEDFICVTADLSNSQNHPEISLSNNSACLIIEDGDFAVSPISPNPIEQLGEFTLILNDSNHVVIEVKDIMGKRCFYRSEQFMPGSHLLFLNLTDWRAGSYFLKVNVGAEVKILQFLKI
ncbi:MAG: C25 family cysteine peptidase, partial [Flavobacteriales bacterium]